jgi:RsiW-degrading membrane proteinase PrsW (M82 family)
MNSSQSGTAALESSTIGQSQKRGTGYVVFGWVFALISLLLLPIFFGAMALYMGYKTFHVRSPLHGIVIMFFAGMGIILGSLYSFVVTGTAFI